MIDVLKPLIKQFLPFAQEKMGFERPPRLFLKQDSQNASNPLGKTAFYDPSAMSITLFVSERHPKDVMRSLSHELVHHTQNCNGDFENAGEMGEGYAQNNPHMREMEREAYDLGNMCFRDWEDSIKGTIYNESLQKGANKRMSTKNWKDRELNTLLLEKWGFKFDLDRLSEEKKPDADGDGAPDWADKKPGEPDESEESEEEELDEGFEKPKSATGSGPTNKGGKVARTDVANKDTSKFGQGGSKGGGKESASGTNTAPKAGKMDRTDVANKATGRWLKEEEELYEMCPDGPHEHPEEDIEGEMEGEVEGDVESLAARAMAAVHELAAAAGADISTSVTTSEEDEEELEERRGRGRADPRNQRGPADPRQRPMAEDRVRKALKGRKVTEAQMRQIIRKTLELRQERKVNKG